jgi:hypothetical protein
MSIVDTMEHLVIKELYSDSLLFFSVLDVHKNMGLKNIQICKEEVRDILEYFFNKQMICRIISQKLNNSYLYLYGGRIVYTTPRKWRYMYDISEFVRMDDVMPDVVPDVMPDVMPDIVPDDSTGLN